MLVFESNNSRMVENGFDMLSMVADVSKGATLFLDIETTSFDTKEGSTNPFGKCWPLGISVMSDKSLAYYIPINHHGFSNNIDVDLVVEALVQIFNTKQRWVNHNIKYDAHVLKRKLGIAVGCPLYDTLDLAKLIDSDRMGFSLDALAYEWLKLDIRGYEKAFQVYLPKKGKHKNKDYGYIPADILGPYANQDVITNKLLWNYILAMMPEESQPLVEVSSQLTSTLLRMEEAGVPIDLDAVKRDEMLGMARQLTIQKELAAIVGYEFAPHLNKDCYDVLCNHYGLPVLEYTDGTEVDLDSADVGADGDEEGDEKGPSFAMSALVKYKALPGAPLKVIDLILEFRKLNSLVTKFLRPWQKLHVESKLHGTYNPTVRTGRMSCKRPNMQQLMELAKRHIRPRKGRKLISADYSQIEFRVIGHYIQDQKVIAAYLSNPNTDFHNWVKDECGINRKPAKTVNFLMGYGGGKKRLLSQLVLIPELVGHIADELQTPAYADYTDAQKKQMFNDRALQKATSVYTIYHDTLPGIRRVSRMASDKVLAKGFVVNWFGRRRTLPQQVAWRAFNTLCQGTAADMMKERLVALDAWLLQEYHGEIKMIMVIHDEVVLDAPEELVDDYLLDSICYILEDISRPLRIPIRTSIGVSSTDWLEASKETSSVRDFDRTLFRPNGYWGSSVYDREIISPIFGKTPS